MYVYVCASEIVVHLPLANSSRIGKERKKERKKERDTHPDRGSCSKVPLRRRECIT